MPSPDPAAAATNRRVARGAAPATTLGPGARGASLSATLGRVACTAALALTLASLAVAATSRRVVSLNPSLTAIAVALGAGDALVGVDDWSARSQPEVAGLPRVGGLYSPSVEAVLALRPDLVMLVPSAEQRGFRERLAELGVELLVLDPVSFDDVAESVVTVGQHLGREAAGRARAEALRSTRAAVERATRDRPRPGVVLVLQRDPLYVIGRGSFVDEMLQAAGGRNLAAEVPEVYPRVSREWLIAAAPEVILDAAPGEEPAQRYWSRWPSLPAVREGRVVAVASEVVTLPGPHLDRALLTLARALHGSQLSLPRAGSQQLLPHTGSQEPLPQASSSAGPDR